MSPHARSKSLTAPSCCLALIALALFLLAFPWTVAQGQLPDAAPAAPEVVVDEGQELKPITNSREMLAERGLDAERLNRLMDGEPISDDERQTLWRMLVEVRRLSFADLRIWAERKMSWVAWAREPATFRGQTIELRGRVKRVTIEKLPEALADRFDLAQYYRCEFLLGDEADPAVIYTLKIPKAWKIDEPLDERSGARGVFLKLTASAPSPLTPVFVAQRAAWYPPTELGDLGMDVGLFDEVTNKERIAARDAECFYELLAAAKKASGKELRERTGEKMFPVEPLYAHPEQQQGKLVALMGTARRAILVHENDPKILAAYGIDHFYEVEIFTADSQGNPITFNVLELPANMKRGEHIYEDVWIAGFFLKTWTYRIFPPGAKVDEETRHRRQVAPLLISPSLFHIVREPPDQTTELLKGSIFTAMILGAAASVWWFYFSDRKFRARTIAKKYEPADLRSLNDIGKRD